MLTQPSGVLRASLPVDFAVTYLASLIAEFALLYPSINFEFDFTPRRVDLVSEPFDVAIRIGESKDSQLIARRLASLVPNLYASPGYIKRSGQPRTPTELVQHQCVTIMSPCPWTLCSGKKTVEVQVSGRFRLNSIGMLRRLAALDQGIVLLPEEVVADELASGKLQRIMPEWHGLAQSVYAITETRLLPAKTQRFIEFLCKRFELKNSAPEATH
jgi:DNA-binding transcriptional LysR family regulator